MKTGTRALGIAESSAGESASGDRSTLAGVVVRADRTVDGFAFGSCTIGGTDATGAVIDLFDRLGRADVQYLFLSGIAPAWYNLFDPTAIAEATDRPVLSVSFEASDGLEEPLRTAFSGAALRKRLDVYEGLSPRVELSVNDERVFVRAAGCEDPPAVVRAFSPEGGRPEPLRLARLAARGARVLTASG